MTTIDLLLRLRNRDVRLWIEGEQLRFSAPKGALTPELRAELGARKAEVIAFLEQATAGSNGPPIRPARRDGPMPLSFAQQRLWFLDQLAPGMTGYHIPTAIRLKGALDIEALRRCVATVISRHEILRTTFSTVDAQPVQVIAPSLHVPLPLEDLRDLPAAERDAAVRQHSADDERRPFDLRTGPLLRGRVLQLADDEFVAIFTLHHIITDMWSMGILINELAALYTAEVSGKPSYLPNLPVQYADFAVWQRDWLEHEDQRGGSPLRRQMAYWRQQLTGDLPVLDLPTDRPRPMLQTFTSQTQPFSLEPELSAALRTLTQHEGATLFMTLLAGFQVLLHRYTGLSDILVGSPIAGRTRTEIEPLIGFFVNTLVLRADLSGTPSFRTLLNQDRDMTLAAYAHQDLPFEMLVEDLRPARSLSRTPIFQVMFALQNAPIRAIELPGLTLQPIQISNSMTPFDLTFQMMEQDGEIRGLVDYNVDLFDATTITRLIGHYRTLLTAAAADPDQSIAALPLLPPAERQQIVSDWNQTDVAFPQDRLVHELVAALATSQPDALAAVSATDRLSYGELNRRASQLAHYLRTLGIGPEIPVAVCMERTPRMLVALLAVLKAGGAYLPLDPAQPAERLRFMIADAAAPVLISQQSLVDLHFADGLRLDAAHSTHLINLDRDGDRIAALPDSVLPRVATPAQLAYLIYTSGSTGTPKGVEVTHANLLNLVAWHTTAYALTPADRCTHLAGAGFDASVWEIWPALAAGATLHLPDDETRLAPERLRDWLLAQRITVSFAPTPLAEELLALPWPSDTPLRYVLTGGDALHRYPRADLPFTLINHYGPTECTVLATAGVVPSEGPVAQAPSIGRATANARVYILDAQMQPVPIGVPGEIYIGGAGVARGYRNRPDLTAESFVASPFAVHREAGSIVERHASERLYRTGDLARWRVDGQIEFLGRRDSQVKVRGYRIELGEIEAVLLQHSAVREAVVVPRADAAGAIRLVAYLAADSAALGETPESRPIAARLRAFLRDRLPEYMVPSAFVVLDTLPRTPNGKIDRRALPEHEADSIGDEQSYVAPRTPAEETIAALAAEVLNIERIGIHDNFFDLGGHSLLGTRLVTRLREVFGVEMALRSLFETPTVAGLAEHIEALQWASQALPVLSDGDNDDRQEGEL